MASHACRRRHRSGWDQGQLHVRRRRRAVSDRRDVRASGAGPRGPGRRHAPGPGRARARGRARRRLARGGGGGRAGLAGPGERGRGAERSRLDQLRASRRGRASNLPGGRRPTAGQAGDVSERWQRRGALGPRGALRDQLGGDGDDRVGHHRHRTRRRRHHRRPGHQGPPRIRRGARPCPDSVPGHPRRRRDGAALQLRPRRRSRIALFAHRDREDDSAGLARAPATTRAERGRQSPPGRQTGARSGRAGRPALHARCSASRRTRSACSSTR